MDPACSCEDFKFHGRNLTPRRVLNKVRAALDIGIHPHPQKESVYIADSGSGVAQFVTWDGNSSKSERVCKHIIALFWKLGKTPCLVGFKDPDWGNPRYELRLEAYWLDEKARILIEQSDPIEEVIELFSIGREEAKPWLMR